VWPVLVVVLDVVDDEALELAANGSNALWHLRQLDDILNIACRVVRAAVSAVPVNVSVMLV
jgi:hypothetical protein